MTDFRTKVVERYYQGKLISLSGNGCLNTLTIDGENVGYFENVEQVEHFFEVLSDLFTAFETVGGFKDDGYSE